MILNLTPICTLSISICSKSILLYTMSERSIKSEHFPHYNDNIVRLNSGSFGCCPASVLALQSEYRTQWLIRPDKAFTLLGHQLKEALAATVSLFKPGGEGWNEKFCFTENATVATAIVARYWNLVETKKKFLVIADCIYGGSRRVHSEYMKDTELLELELLVDDEGVRSFPLNKAALLHRFNREWDKALTRIERLSADDGRDVLVFCHFDYVSSMPALLFPIKEMLALVRSSGYQINTLVDAAQAFLYKDFDVKEEFGDPDFALVNLHKWNCAPMSVALLYSSRPRDVHHVIPTWNPEVGPSLEGLWTGTRDYTSYLASPAAINFLTTWRSDKGETASQFCRRNLRESVEYLATAWGTRDTYLQSEDILPPNVAMVMLPTKVPPIDNSSFGPRGVPGENMRSILRDKYDIECKVAHFEGIGNFLRLSFALFNTGEDIVALERAVSELVDQL